MNLKLLIGKTINRKGRTMRKVRFITAVVAVLLTLVGFQNVTFSQDQTSAPRHVHYQETGQQSQASPTGALAPRLQKLGNHAFPVSTKNPQAQLFMNQGLNL